MKAYNIVPKEIQIAGGPVQVLTLGESGRGRELKIIKVDAQTENVSVKVCGTSSLKIVDTENVDGMWLARISTEGAYIRNALGACYIPKDQIGQVRVLARGYGAFGDAGRIGTWYDYLLSVATGTLIKVKRTRYAAYWLHFTEDNVKRIKREELDIYLDMQGIPLIEDVIRIESEESL